MKMWNVAKSCGKNHIVWKKTTIWHGCLFAFCVLAVKDCAKSVPQPSVAKKNVSIAWLSMCLTGMPLPIFRQ